MDLPTSPPPKPAALLRRMTPPAVAPVLRRDASAPLVRCAVEMNRGSLIIRLEAAAETGAEAIQWTQNGAPLSGQTGPALHLANLTPDDTDLYYALMRSAAGESRSQPCLVVVTPGQPLLNFSARGQVAPGRPLIAGFVIGRAGGSAHDKRYLLRALGPSLQRFGVGATLAHPSVTLFRRRAKAQEPVALEQDEAFLRECAPRVGAMALDREAHEFAGAAELSPGSYSLVVTGADGEAGEVLVEIYELPP